MAPFFFALCMFFSAALLFLVEPMLARMILPLLGGTPAVWNTCLVFFQVVLFAGYLYAHASMQWLGKRTQITVHLAVVLAALLVLPLSIPASWIPPPQADPVWWILATLSMTVGLPFFALSATAPILQRWFAQTDDESAADPYFLYAASNAGSLLGLLSYPLLLEPLLRLSTQSRFWSFGYAALLAMMALCAALVWRSKAVLPVTAERVTTSDVAGRPSWINRARWVALAFVPSSLMLGVTTALTRDVPAIPFFWVLPLALYLLSFVLVFASKPPIPHQTIVRRMPFLILLSLIPTVTKTRLPISILLALYLPMLFVVAMVCHGELARNRPGVSRLTEFYLLMSLGGVLGGIFNALVAPVVFTSVVEFPIALVLAALLRPDIGNPENSVRSRIADVLLPSLLGLSMVGAILLARHLGLKAGLAQNGLVFSYSILWCLSFGKRQLRFALGLAALLLASSLYTGPFGRILHAERSFFGVSRVTDGDTDGLRYLFQGGTIHGVQKLDKARSREPLAYYTKSGPIGQVFEDFSEVVGNVAIVGLGAGAMACYIRPSEVLTYYEIDQSVEAIATNPSYFTFLSQCAPQARIVLGDARLSLRSAQDSGYRMIVLDAFSSDSVPMHLLTKEALQLYLKKLAPGGVLAFHISNIYLDLAPALGAQAHSVGLVSMMRDEQTITQAESDDGKLASKWVVMARTTTDLRGLTRDARWVTMKEDPNARAWTDDYSSLLGTIKWH